MNNSVNHPVLQKEFGLLKASRNLLTDGLLNNPRPGKTNHGPRFRENDIPQGGKTGGYSTGGWMSQYHIYNNPWREKRSTAALVLAICIGKSCLPACELRQKQ